MTNKHSTVTKEVSTNAKVRATKAKAKESTGTKKSPAPEDGHVGLIRSNSLYESLAAEQREHIFEHIRFLEEKVAELEQRAMVIEERLDQIESFFIDMATAEAEMELAETGTVAEIEENEEDEDEEEEDEGSNEPEEDQFGQKFDTSSYFV